MEKHIEMKICNYKPCVSRGLLICFSHRNSDGNSAINFLLRTRKFSKRLIGILIRIENGSALSNVCRMGIKFFAGEVRVGTPAPI